MDKAEGSVLHQLGIRAETAHHDIGQQIVQERFQSYTCQRVGIYDSQFNLVFHAAKLDKKHE